MSAAAREPYKAGATAGSSGAALLQSFERVEEEAIRFVRGRGRVVGIKRQNILLGGEVGAEE